MASTALLQVGKVDRALNREQHSLYNCLLSILDDTRFVDEIRALHPELPVFVNLRCGLWYSQGDHQTCYFKSTDGHFGNWSFSCVRLNLHVAEACARHGGCVLVDATRRGKTFPDAFTKTVPIWCAVLNTAIQLQRKADTARQCKTDAAHPQFPQAFSTGNNINSSSNRHIAAAADEVLLSETHQASTPPSQTANSGCSPVGSATEAHSLQLACCEATSALHNDAEPVSESSMHQQELDFSTPFWKDTNGFSESVLNTRCTESAPLRVKRRGNSGCSPPMPTAVGERGDKQQAIHNRADTRCTTSDAHQRASHSESPSESQRELPQAWDTNLHVPLWITKTEHSLITPQVPSWAQNLLSTCRHSLPEALVGLQKPLRPLWVCQNSRIWTNHVAPAHTLPFTPLYLVSASLPALYQRRVASIPRGIHSHAPGGVVQPPSSARVTGIDLKHDLCGQGDSSDRLQEDVACCADAEVDTHETVSYVYIPGAGDDEETWAQGLTPGMFWNNLNELLEPGPVGISERAAGLLQGAQYSTQRSTQASTQHSPQHTEAHRHPSESAVPESHAELVRANGTVTPVVTDAHHLKPQGCNSNLPKLVNEVATGCFAVPHCGVVLCTAAAAQSLLQGAVCMHAAPSVSMACHDMHDGTGSLPTHGSVKDTSCENEHLRCMLRMRESRVTDLAKQGVVGVLDLRGSGVHTAEHASVEACSSKRAVVGTSELPYLWLHVHSSKRHRTSLQHALPAATAFIHTLCTLNGSDTMVSMRTSSAEPAADTAAKESSRVEASAAASSPTQDPKVLVLDDCGEDTCVCVAVAMLLLKDQQQKYLRGASGSYEGVSCAAASVQERHVEQSGHKKCEPCTKEEVKQALARVCQSYPPARPTRASLKQVYQFIRTLGSEEAV